MKTALALYFALLPFFFSLPFFPGIDLPLGRLLAVFLFLFWLAISLFRRELCLPLTLPVFFLVSFLFWATLSLVWAENQGWALRKALFLWSFLPLFMVLVSLKGRLLDVLRAALWGGAAAAAAGLIQFFLQFPLGVERVFRFWLDHPLPFFLGMHFGEAVAAYPSLLVNVSGATLLRASAFFPDPHIFAFYMGMLAPLGLVLALQSQGRRKKVFFLVAALLLVADFLSFSRGGYIGLLLGGLFFFSCFFRSWFFSKRKLALGVALVLILGSVAFSPVGNRLASSFSPTDTSSLERLRLWREAVTHIQERPLFGTGLGNYPLLVKPSAAYREPIYVHNLFLDIAVEVGLPGLFFFVGFLVSVFWWLWKKWKMEKDLLSLGVMASLVVFSGHALFETPLFSVHILPLLMLLTAFATFSHKKPVV